MDGILLVDKETDITSYDVIRRIKRALGTKVKIGHAGTLDPFAAGLLVILFGKATKLQDRIHELSKVYVVAAQFGFETDTLDITGDQLYFSGVIPTKEEIVAVLPKFTGEIEQTPPKYSAVKVSGERAYKLAREGKEFELKSKKVIIKNIELLKYEETQAVFRIECSTGTYIRSLVADIGRSLNTFATAELLIRTNIGGFSISDSLESTKITKDNVLKGIISMDKLSEFGL